MRGKQAGATGWIVKPFNPGTVAGDDRSGALKPPRPLRGGLLMLPNPVEISNAEATAARATGRPSSRSRICSSCAKRRWNRRCANPDLAVDALIKAFSGLSESARAMNAMAEKLRPNSAHAFERHRSKKQMDAIERQMSAAIIAFQFYDKLTQRLGHVRYSLSTLAQFVCDRAQSSQRDQWRRLFTTLQAPVSHRRREANLPDDGGRRVRRGNARPHSSEHADAAHRQQRRNRAVLVFTYSARHRSSLEALFSESPRAAVS